jgi:hypothetical protein
MIPLRPIFLGGGSGSSMSSLGLDFRAKERVVGASSGLEELDVGSRLQFSVLVFMLLTIT